MCLRLVCIRRHHSEHCVLFVKENNNSILRRVARSRSNFNFELIGLRLVCTSHLSQFVWCSSHIWSHFLYVLCASAVSSFVSLSKYIGRIEIVILKYQSEGVLCVCPETVINSEQKITNIFRWRKKNSKTKTHKILREKNYFNSKDSATVKKIKKNPKELSQMFYLKWWQ